MQFCCTPSVLHAPPVFVQCRVLIVGAVLLLLLWVLTSRAYSMLQIADHHHRHHVSIPCHALPSLPHPTNSHIFCGSVAVGKQLKAVAFNIFNLWFKFVSLGSSVRKAARNALGDISIWSLTGRDVSAFIVALFAQQIYQEVQYRAIVIN